jgi:hypothetical protein
MTAPTMTPPLSPTLRERLLTKIVMPGPATPCATWVGAYNIDGRRSRSHRGVRPVIYPGGPNRKAVAYAAPTLLRVAGVEPERADQTEACHRGCPCGPSWDGVYRCTDLAHLEWGTRAENEADKRER